MELSIPLRSSFPNVYVKRSKKSHEFFENKAISSDLQRRRLEFVSKNRRPFQEKDAFPSSLPLHSKNPSAIYKDIKRFARSNKLKEALTILDYLDQQGIPVNATTFSALLAACMRNKSLEDGRQVHVHIRINGLENNDFLRTKLVKMYTSCGSLQEAQKVFDECTSSSVYPWNALLRGAVISGKKRYRDVLSTYSEMRELGVVLNVYSFSSIIKSLAGASALRQGFKVHAQLVKNGLVGSMMLRTGLIDLYFKCGKIKHARSMFDEIDERDVVVWGTMVAGFAHNRLNWEALDYFRWMIEEGLYPNSVLVTTISPVIGEVGALNLGKELHAYVMKTGDYLKQLPIQSGLVDMYSKCRNLELARKVFYSSAERNAISWTSLMSGYISNGRLDQALRSIVWMQQEGYRPDVVTIATILPVCAKIRALNHGKEVHAYTVKNCFLPNLSISTSLMMLYSKCGVLSYSSKLFNILERKNVVAWTAMIDSYAENCCLSDALDVFRSMNLSEHRPDSVTVARILCVCSQLKALNHGKEIHGYLLKKKFESIPFVASEIIRMYGNCGQIDRAKLVFDAVAVKGSMVWTAIIEAYGLSNLWREAMGCFNKMKSEGFKPTQFTFKVALSICNRAGLVEQAFRILSSMSHRYGLKASEEHYSIVIELLNRSGHTFEAQRLMETRASILS